MRNLVEVCIQVASTRRLKIVFAFAEVIGFGGGEIVVELSEMGGDAAELVGSGAGFGFDELQTIDDGADGAATFFGDRGDGEFFDVVELEDGGETRMFAAAFGVEVVKDGADAAGEVLAGGVGELRGEVGKK
jgi:hypothetical protein